MPIYYEHDGHGSVRALTNSAGSVSDTYDYDAFGNLIHSTGTTPNNYLFAGEQFDPNLNLYYNRARYLSTNTGRFWTADAFEGTVSVRGWLSGIYECCSPSGGTMRRNLVNLAVIIAFGVFAACALAAFLLRTPLLGFLGMLVFVVTLGIGAGVALYDGVVSSLKGPRVSTIGAAVTGFGILLVFAGGVGRLLSTAQVLQQSTFVGLVLFLTGLLLQLLDSAARYLRASFRERKFGLALFQIVAATGVGVLLGYYDLRFFRMLR